MEPLGMRRMGEHDYAAKDPLLLTEAEAYELYAPDTAFVIDLSLIGSNSFRICPAAVGTSLNHAVVDWGDGTKEEWDLRYWGTERTHVYAKQGRYVVRMRGMSWSSYDFRSEHRPAIIRALRFADTADCGIFDFSGCANLTAFPDGKLARWPKDAKTIGWVYRFCTSLAATELPEWPEGVTKIQDVYGDCSAFNLTKIPEWPSTLEWLDMGGVGSTGLYGNMPNLRLTTLPKWPKSLKKITAHNWNGLFRGCPNVTAEPPEWPEGLEQADCVYNYGTPLSGSVPAWPDGLTSAGGTFSGCSGLTGGVPAEWPSGLTNADSTFYNCSGLTGSVPAEWPSGLTRANYTFYNCSGLTGSVPAWSNCTALTSIEGVYAECAKLTGEIPAFPPNVKNVNRAYQRCIGLYGDAPDWPDTVTTAYDTFWNTKVSGLIKKWGAAMVTARWTYENCKSLTGAWTSDPDELMPTNITSHGNCVSGASDALRALFYSDWGGTRTKEETTTT